MRQQKLVWKQDEANHSDTRMLEKCECGICAREELRSEPVSAPETFEQTTEVPFGQSLAFLLDRLAEVSHRLVERMKLNLPETFFFRDSKVAAFYYTNERGELAKSTSPLPLKKVEEIILRRKEGARQQPSPKGTHPYYTSVGEKEERERKMKNEVAIIKLLNGGFTIVSQFNLPFEIQKARHIDYVQLYSKHDTEFVKFDYVTHRSEPLYERARIYALIMRGEVTDWDNQYISRADESNFQLELYREDLAGLLLYLTLKIVHVLCFSRVLLLKGRFDWMVNRSTSALQLFNVEGLQYCNTKPDGKIDIEQFKKMQEQRVEQRLLGLSARKTHYQFNHRVDNYQALLYRSYEKVKYSIIPSMPTLGSLTESDVAFKKLHPEIQDNLKDILRDKDKFTRTLNTIHGSRTGSRRHRRVETMPAEPITPQGLGFDKKLWLGNHRRQLSVKDRRDKFMRSVSKGLHAPESLDHSRIQVNLSRVLNRTSK